MELLVQGLPVQLKAFHDLRFVGRYGRLFQVFDQLSSGMLCFGVQGKDGKLFLKYAGAPCVQYPSSPAMAVEKLHRAAENYRLLRHPMLVELLAQEELPGGLLLVFRWEEGLPLAPIRQHYEAFRKSSLLVRLRLYDQLLQLQVKAERAGLLIAGLSDSHLLYDPAHERLTLSNIDDYLELPCYNQRGRLPGSPYYLPPEAYRRGAGLDETSNVYTMAALSFAFFGDRRARTRTAWEGSQAMLNVAMKAISEKPEQRYASLPEYQEAWREAVLRSPMG